MIWMDAEHRIPTEMQIQCQLLVPSKGDSEEERGRPTIIITRWYSSHIQYSIHSILDL